MDCVIQTIEGIAMHAKIPQPFISRKLHISPNTNILISAKDLIVSRLSCFTTRVIFLSFTGVLIKHFSLQSFCHTLMLVYPRKSLITITFTIITIKLICLESQYASSMTYRLMMHFSHVTRFFTNSLALAMSAA